MEGVRSAVVERFDVRSTDPEFAHDLLRRTYGADFEVRLSGSTEDFRFELEGAAVPEIAVGRSSYNTAAEMDVPPLVDHFIAATHLSGQARFADDREEIGRGARHAAVDAAGPRVPATSCPTSTSASCPCLGGRGGPGGPVGAERAPARPRFTSMAPVSAGAARYWHSVLDHLRNTVLADDEVAATPLVLAEATRSLAIAALLTFPNTALDRLSRGPRPPAGPSRGGPPPGGGLHRRARRRGDRGRGRRRRGPDRGPRTAAHVPPPPGLHAARTAAAGADGSVPTPTCRQGTRRAGDTVAAIAGRWGFTNPGRFSVQYRQAYGCSPGETLRR